LGAAAAAYAVGKGAIDPDWMILESCYDNIHHALSNRLALRLGSSLTPLIAWPIEFVVEQLVQLRAEDLDPARAMEKARCPVLLLAGDSEKVLKSVEIEYLYGCIPEPKRCMLFPGAGHEDLLAYDPRRYAKAVGTYLREVASGHHRNAEVTGTEAR
jgi:alpha-beta hydrolase superfamily lysophospholipase